MPFNNTPVLRNAASISASDATRLRVLAGTPHSRRGSVLVLVVGVLALLAIIIVVYTSVGQADVRGARTLVNQARLEDQSNAIGEYIRVIVGNDASAVRIQQVALPSGGDRVNLSVLERTDYPYTDPATRSQIATLANRDIVRFDPAGSITSQWTATGNNLDPRVSSDPFLASTEPVWSNRAVGTLPAVPPPFSLLGRHRDWAHMSLISPSGLPINLANLRGNWAAASGFTAASLYPTTGTRMMSDWLYTWAPTNNAGYMDPPSAIKLPQAQSDLYNSPAHWSNDCLETFRPTTWNVEGYHAGDVRFMGNTLGDADGDGFYDSRWQELVDVSDPTRPINLLPGGTGGGVRWFIAPRIIDLSSLVNVNIATSFAVAPDIENPAGLTPSDVDLERLLTTADARQYFNINPRTLYVNGAATYSNVPLDITNAGRWAFSGILEGRATGLIEVVDNSYVDSAGTGLVSPVWLADMGVQRTGNPPALGAVTRTILYTMAGKDAEDGQLRNPVGTTTGYYLKTPGGYGQGDERELRAQGAVNNPGSPSRLEATAATMARNNTPQNVLMSPFRSGRDLTIDRDAGLSTAAADLVGAGNNQVPRGVPQYFGDVRHLLTTVNGARPLSYGSPGLLLTPTTSAARTITDADLRPDINALLQKALAVTPTGANNTNRIYPLTAANTIFSNYALALSPFLGSVGLNAPSQSLWNEASGGTNSRALALSWGGVTYNTATSGVNVGETVAPLFKGRAAEIAVRTAAHMTLNAMAARDNTNASANPLQPPDGRPLAATVLLDHNDRNYVSTDTYAPGVKRFPYWQAGTARLGNVSAPPNALGSGPNDVKAYTFDLNGGQNVTVQRLSSGTPAGYPSAVNVFATQPQPFITAAVTFDMYYDAPVGDGGDGLASGPGDLSGEFVQDTPAPTYRSLGITINGDVDNTNSDFLMEAMAFQVTNPFDTTLTLGDTNGAYYYFEFAGKFYDARAYNESGALINTPVQIGPRQSMCFYVLSETPDQVLTRWRRADSTIDDLAGRGETAVTAWIRNQITVSVGGKASVRTVQIDPTNPTNPVNVPFQRILTASATSDDNKVVKLWRVVLDGSAGEVRTANKTQNDYLVDRLHEPTFGTGAGDSALYRRLQTGYNRFRNIPAGPDTSDPLFQTTAVQKENVGYALTMFGAVRRRTDPNGGPLPGQVTEATTGVMPAWCVEAKHAGSFMAPAGARNLADVNVPDLTLTASPSFFTSNTWSGRSFRQMLTNGIGSPSYTTAVVHPARRKGINDPAIPAPGDSVNDRLTTDLDGVDWVTGGKAMQLPVYPRRTTTPTLADVQLPPLRPADLLMPWAIGPYQYGGINPVATNAANYHAIEEVRNITLSEAMAMGLNYSRGRADTTYEFQIGQALDRCHLPTDRFVPFSNSGTPGVWSYNNGNSDPSIANGIPFALNILDRFRTNRYGSIDSAVPGLVNINTAPLSVYRTLPLLTPVSANIAGTDRDGFDGSWMNGTATGPFALRMVNENGSVNNARSLWDANEQWDLAATLIAYRDQQAVVARGAQGSEAGNTRRYVDFSRGTATIAGNDGNLFNNPSGNGKHTGRAFMNNVVNGRQELGFGSPGEVLLALVQDNTTRSNQPSLTPAQQKALSMDRMETTTLNPDGTQAQPTNFQSPVYPINSVTARGLTTPNETARTQPLGLTSFTSSQRVTAGTTEHFVQGGRSSDYDRKIAIANALLNTISTSSDLYCAYFLVNGYTEADTRGLEAYTGTGNANDDRYTRAMTPSVQRRYMMVLDRSACVRAGDKPKVLMFEELPVN